MLKEIIKVRQVKNEGKRRWFSDNYFDLVIWYDNSNKIEGFQLCYDINKKERSLTWRKNGKYSHNNIDSGESPYKSKKSPIAIPDGIFKKNKIPELFKNESKEINQTIANFVYNKIIKYTE